MKTEELKQKITDEFGESEFRKLVLDRYYGEECEEQANRFKSVVGVSFDLLNGERSEGSGDFDGYTWRFKIDGKLYEVEGYYSSYDGADLDDVMSFYRVKPIQKTITVYEPLSDGEED